MPVTERRTICLIMAALSVALSSVPKDALASMVVYDATTSPGGGGQGATIEQGESITLAGSDRAVQLFRLGVKTSGATGTFDLRIRFYDDDGPGGAPNTLLWDSSTIQDIPVTGTLSFLNVPVPNVVVPSTFVWTALTSDSPSTIFRGITSTVSTGTYNKTWSFSGSWFSSVSIVFQTVQITAAPIPETSSFLCVGAICFGAFSIYLLKK